MAAAVGPHGFGLDLGLLLGAAFLLRVWYAFTYPGSHHPDEVFQTLEPAFWLLTGKATFTWEWFEGIRSWFVPAVFAVPMGLARIFSDDPLVYIGVVWLILIVASTVTVIFGHRIGTRHFGRTGGFVTGAFCALAPELVLFSARTLTEVFASFLLVVAAMLAEGVRERPAEARRRVVIIGVLLGFAFYARFHLGPALALVALRVCIGDFRERARDLIVGAATPFLLLGASDYYA